MRAIDADMLMEEVNHFSMRITGSANGKRITIMEETKKSIAKMIDEQPTVYEVDKVIETLEEYQSQQSQNEMLSDNGKWLVQRVIKECVKIVKANLLNGGDKKNEEV